MKNKSDDLIYPFTSNAYAARQLFREWVQKNMDWLNENHGCRVYTGKTVHGEMSWSYYEVDVEFIGPNTVQFHTYGMLDSFHGGRGALQQVFTVDYAYSRIEAFIERRKLEVATEAFEEDERFAERMRITMAVEAKYKELFGEKP